MAGVSKRSSSHSSLCSSCFPTSPEPSPEEKSPSQPATVSPQLVRLVENQYLEETPLLPYTPFLPQLPLRLRSYRSPGQASSKESVSEDEEEPIPVEPSFSPYLAAYSMDRKPRNTYRNRPRNRPTVSLPRISDNNSLVNSNESTTSKKNDEVGSSNSAGYFSASYSSEDGGFGASEYFEYDAVETEKSIEMARFKYSKGLPISVYSPGRFQDLRKELRISPRISVGTINQFGVKAVASRDGFMFPRYLTRGDHGEPSGVKTVQVLWGNREDVRVVEDVEPKIRFAGFFGFNLLSEDDREIVLCASEADAMAVFQDTKLPAIANPNGIGGLAPEAYSLLEQFERIVIWFPSDVVSWGRAKKLAARLGQHRCFIVKPGTNVMSPNEMLSGNRELEDILRTVQPVMPTNVETFPTMRSTVFDYVLNRDKHAGVEWKRFRKLTACLKGFRPGEMTLITGQTGCGKTTFVSELSVDLAEQGVRHFWCNAEISNAKLIDTMLRQHSRGPIERIDLLNNAYDRLEMLPITFSKFHGATDMETIMKQIKEAIYNTDVQHVVIDNLQFVMGMDFSDNGDRFLKQDRFIEHFRRLATHHKVHVTIVVHPRKENQNEELTTNSIFGGAKAVQEADNILILQTAQIPVPPYQKKYLQVIKNRFDGDLILADRAVVEFDKRTCCFSIGKSRNKLQD